MQRHPFIKSDADTADVALLSQNRSIWNQYLLLWQLPSKWREILMENIRNGDESKEVWHHSSTSVASQLTTNASRLFMFGLEFVWSQGKKRLQLKFQLNSTESAFCLFTFSSRSLNERTITSSSSSAQSELREFSGGFEIWSLLRDYFGCAKNKEPHSRLKRTKELVWQDSVSRKIEMCERQAQMFPFIFDLSISSAGCLLVGERCFRIGIRRYARWD